MPPVNDNFANRIPLNELPITIPGTNVDATSETGEPNNGGLFAATSVWWTWTATVAGDYAVTSIGSDFDTTIAIYTGTAVNALTAIATNDDIFLDPFFSLQSAVKFTATAGTTYEIALDGYSGSTGSFVFNLAKVTQGTDRSNRLTGTSNSDYIEGVAGNDTIVGGGGYDVLLGGIGNDQITGGSLSDYLEGGAGNDILFSNGGNDILRGGDGNDRIYGGPDNDRIDAGLGNDTIYGNGGNDVIYGGEGNDLILGGVLGDTLLGGAGDDTLYSNGGADQLDSGSGNDTIWLGISTETAIVALSTGDGFDTLRNFQLGQALFQLDSGVTFGGLTFADTTVGASISLGNDLLAVVSNTTASVLTSNPGIFV